MKISEQGIKMLKRLEGFRAKLYDDVAGQPTIGYGHLVRDELEDFAGMELTDDAAELLLREDIQLAERAVDQLVKVPLRQGQYDALISFTFNLGVGTLQKSTLLRILNEGRCCSVPDQMRRFVHAGGKRIKGLVLRRETEIALWNGET